MFRSSTSSSDIAELGPHERIQVSRIPAGAIACLLCIVAIEAMLYAHREWFADLAAWQWEAKRTLIDRHLLDGPVAVFGSSVFFHGLDAAAASAEAEGPRIVNLALNGMVLSQQAQLLRTLVEEGRAPSTAVLEFRHAAVDRESWTTGPYFRSWASFADFAQSGFYFSEPAAAITFGAHRLFPSFRYREGLARWLSDSVRALEPVRSTRDRNREVHSEMQSRNGLVRAFEYDQAAAPAGPGGRVWMENAAGEAWLHRFVQLAVRHGIRIVLLTPPSSPYLVERPGPDGFRARRAGTLGRLRRAFPAAKLEVFEPAGYRLEHFADDLHLNALGRRKLTHDFAAWIRQPEAPCC